MGRTFHHLRVDIHLTGRACWKRIASDATSSRDNNARFSSRQLLACAEILLRCSRLSQEVCSVGFRLWRLCVQSRPEQREEQRIYLQPLSEALAALSAGADTREVPQRHSGIARACSPCRCVSKRHVAGIGTLRQSTTAFDGFLRGRPELQSKIRSAANKSQRPVLMVWKRDSMSTLVAKALA